MHQRILDGVRGPRGGYRLSRESGRISVADVLRAANTAVEGDDSAMPTSQILDHVVLPAIAEAEKAFLAALARLTIDDLARGADASDAG